MLGVTHAATGALFGAACARLILWRDPSGAYELAVVATMTAGGVGVK